MNVSLDQITPGKRGSVVGALALWQVLLIMISKYKLPSRYIFIDKYFCKDVGLQNYTKIGLKRIINPFIFQNNFQFLLVNFLYFDKYVLRVSFETLMAPQIKQKYTLFLEGSIYLEVMIN